MITIYFTVFIIVTVIINCLLTGASLDQSIKQLPSRRKLGILAFSNYSQASDLKNGVIWYGVLGIGSAVLTLFSFIYSIIDLHHTRLMYSLAAASLFTIGHTVTTAIAAPLNFSQMKSVGNAIKLTRIFNRFEVLQSIRVALQILTLAALVWSWVIWFSPVHKLTLSLIITAVVAGLGASASLDQSIKQLPARHGIGVTAYSEYSKIADKLNARFWYLPLAFIWLACILASVIMGWFKHPTVFVSAAYGVMVFCVIAHTLVTALFAGPLVLSQDKYTGNEKELKRLFKQFAGWNGIRVIIDIIALISTVAALIGVQYHL